MNERHAFVASMMLNGPGPVVPTTLRIRRGLLFLVQELAEEHGLTFEEQFLSLVGHALITRFLNDVIASALASENPSDAGDMFKCDKLARVCLEENLTRAAGASQ